jgi:hypothetical protein
MNRKDIRHEICRKGCISHPEESGMLTIQYRETLTGDEVELLEGFAASGEACGAQADAGADSVEGGGGVPGRRDHCHPGSICHHDLQHPAKMCRGRRRSGPARPEKTPKLTEKQCAHVIATACTPSPAGHNHLSSLPFCTRLPTRLPRCLSLPCF